jgi:hypothetical protein
MNNILTKKFLNESRTTNIELFNACKELGIDLRSICFKEQLKSYMPQIGFYIINLGKNTHWVCFLLHKNGSYYFDSFGLAPPIEIQDFAKRFGATELYYSDVQIQNIESGGCGQYCLLWCYNMQKGHGDLKERYDHFLHEFKPIREFKPV